MTAVNDGRGASQTLRAGLGISIPKSISTSNKKLKSQAQPSDKSGEGICRWPQEATPGGELWLLMSGANPVP